MAHLCETKRFAGFPDSGRLAVAAAVVVAVVVVVVVVVVVSFAILSETPSEKCAERSVRLSYVNDFLNARMA
jgi:hypothetical protein